MPASQHEHVRKWATCVVCDGFKDQGLLLCWVCHHTEKRRNEGTYSAAVEKKLDDLESLLSKPTP